MFRSSLLQPHLTWKNLHVTNYCGGLKHNFCVCTSLALFLNYSVIYLSSPGTPNIHNAWPHSLLTFQDLRQTSCRQNRFNVKAIHVTPPPSPYPSVSSCISDWEYKLLVDSSSQDRYPGTPQHRSWTPGPPQGTKSVGRRQGQRWTPDTQAPAATFVDGVDIDAQKRVSVLAVVSSF